MKQNNMMLTRKQAIKLYKLLDKQRVIPSNIETKNKILKAIYEKYQRLVMFNYKLINIVDKNKDKLPPRTKKNILPKITETKKAYSILLKHKLIDKNPRQLARFLAFHTVIMLALDEKENNKYNNMLNEYIHKVKQVFYKMKKELEKAKAKSETSELTEGIFTSIKKKFISFFKAMVEGWVFVIKESNKIAQNIREKLKSLSAKFQSNLEMVVKKLLRHTSERLYSLIDDNGLWPGVISMIKQIMISGVVFLTFGSSAPLLLIAAIGKGLEYLQTASSSIEAVEDLYTIFNDESLNSLLDELEVDE